MPKVIHTATGPNGEKFTRSSTSRRYSHCVIGRPSIDVARRRAQLGHAESVRQFERNTGWAVTGYTPSAWMEGKADHTDPTRTVAQVFREEGRQTAIKWLKGKPDNAQEYADQVLAAALAEIDQREAAKVYDTFVALTWSSRLDLAQAQVGRREFDAFTDFRVVPVDPA